MLNQQAIDSFANNGFLLSTPETSVAADLPAIATFREMLASPGLAQHDPAVDRHLDDPMTLAICTLPQIVEAVAALLGPDLLLWHSRYFDKSEQAPPIPWHQDAPFWAMHPKDCVSAWLALEDAHEGNGCVYAVPGSNRTPLPQILSTGTGRFRKKADITGIDVSAAIPLTRKRGEFYLFHAWLLHRSAGNPQCNSRLAIAMQFIAPHVQLDLTRPHQRIPGFGVLPVRGEDRLRLNPHAKAPG